MIGSRQLRGLAWAVLAVLACALLFALSLHVNALKSKVRQTELRIVSLKHENLYLETEFETRANQQQLEAWNDVDFGYVAPGPGQFVEDDRKLAALARLPQPFPPQQGAAQPPASVRLAGTPAAAAAADRPKAAKRNRAVEVVANDKAKLAKATKPEAKPDKPAAKATAKPAGKYAESKKSRAAPAAEAAERGSKVAALQMRESPVRPATARPAGTAGKATDNSKEERGR